MATRQTATIMVRQSGIEPEARSPRLDPSTKEGDMGRKEFILRLSPFLGIAAIAFVVAARPPELGWGALLLLTQVAMFAVGIKVWVPKEAV